MKVLIYFSLPLTLLGVFLPDRAFGLPAPENRALDPVPQAEVVGDARSLELNEQGIAAMNNKDTVKAEEFFRKALAVDSKNVTAAFNLAGVLINNKKTEEAIALLLEYIKEYNQDPSLFVRLGDAYFASKKIREAATAYEKAFETAGGYPGLAAKLGTIYGLMNRIDDAKRMFMVAVELDPKDSQSLANLSSLFLASGEPDKAIGTARRALQVKATKEVYVTLGTAYEIQKDYKNALIAFQRAVDLGDSREELKKKIEGLKQVAN